MTICYLYLPDVHDGEFCRIQYASKYQKNSKKQKAPKQAIKEASKKAKKDKVRSGHGHTRIISPIIQRCFP